MRQLQARRSGKQIVQTPPRVEEPKPPPRQPRIDPIFKNMDQVVRDMYSFVPNVNSELAYRAELSKDMGLYGFFMFFGALCIVVAITFSL